MTSEKTGRDCIKAIAIQWYPNAYKLTINGSVTYEGTHITLLEEVAKKYDLCFTVEDSPDSVFGEKTANGSFNGAIGSIARNEYDVFVTGSTISYERSEVTDFSVPLFSTSHSVYYRYPKIEPDIFGFLKSFRLEVWIAILMSMFAVFGLMILAFRRQMKSRTKMAETFKAFHSIFGSILCQDLPNLKGLGVAKVVLSLWLPLALILQLTYRCNLNAMLTIRRIDIPFETVEDLITHKGKPVVMVAEATTLDTAIKEAEEESLFGRLNKAVTRFSYVRAEEIFADSTFEENKFAIVLTENSIKGLIHQDFSEKGYCSKAMMRTSFYELNVVMNFPKNSTLKPKVDRIIVGFKEFGILNYMSSRRVVNASKCSVTRNQISKEMRPLVLKDFYGPFAFFATGLAISILTFLGEVIYHTLIE